VVATSVVMERAAVADGERYAVPGDRHRGIVLAAVTSLPNGWYLTLAAASIMLAIRYRGLGRWTGSLIVGGYAVFACALLANGYRLEGGLRRPR
jgi:hypothetical protein